MIDSIHWIEKDPPVLQINEDPNEIQQPKYINVSENSNVIVMGNDSIVNILNCQGDESNWQVLYQGSNIKKAYFNIDNTLTIFFENHTITLRNKGQSLHYTPIQPNHLYWGEHEK